MLQTFQFEMVSRKSWRVGEPVYSMTARLVRSIDIASIAHTAGFDSLYIDMEHSSYSPGGGRAGLHRRALHWA